MVMNDAKTLIFGGHFYPYSITMWLCVSGYNLYVFLQNGYNCIYLMYGIVYASSLWSFTEYVFHRLVLHHVFYKHHKKHHVSPNKLAVINAPLSIVILIYCLYYYVLIKYINSSLMTSCCIFFPLNYVSFEIVHMLSHCYSGTNAIMINAKQYHILHHANDDVNYSFVTPFWDWVFGTLSPKYKMGCIELLLGFVPFYSFYIHK